MARKVARGTSIEPTRVRTAHSRSRNWIHSVLMVLELDFAAHGQCFVLVVAFSRARACTAKIEQKSIENSYPMHVKSLGKAPKRIEAACAGQSGSLHAPLEANRAACDELSARGP